ncbi:MAG: DUF1036 domain-containing protein [Saprospiraceae bacterium]
MKRYIAVFLLFFLSNIKLSAQLFVKNDAPFTVWVAIGYYVPSTKEWYSKGWFKLDDNGSTNIFDYDLSYNSYYYYYAYDNDGNYWVGSSDCQTCSKFLVDTKDPFNINRPLSYDGAKYEWKKFNRLEVGGKSSITLQITGENWSEGDCVNGYGTYKWVADSKKYTGYWSGGRRSGRGTCEYGKYHSTYANCKFEGEWKNNTWDSGTFTWPDGSTFTGKWVDEKKSGKGVLVWADGSKYEGNWANDKRNGQGKIFYADQDKTYTGNWVDDKREGQGTCIYGDKNPSFANCRFEGIWENNTWKSGTLFYADNSRYTGSFSGTKRHGKGSLYSSNGVLLKSGEWVNDILILSDDTKPTITWDAPTQANITSSTNTYQIKACIHAPSGLESVKVYLNGQVYKDRGFTVEDNCTQTVNLQIVLSKGANTVYIVATNAAGASQSETRTIRYGNANIVVSKGRYFGLFIGINDYADLGIVDLENPVADATRLRDILSANYGFEAKNSFLLQNPKKEAIVKKIQALQGILNESDYLLIFFAGHGKMQGNEGYWLCSDASMGNAYNWISSSEVNSYLRNFKSNHILLVSDACYSGAFVMRDVDDIIDNSEQRACEILESQKSRCAMTSGAKASVPDKSVFIEYLSKRLRENQQSCISAEQLYLSFKTAVIANSPNNQIPQFGNIPQTGHEGGGFIFYKK